MDNLLTISDFTGVFNIPNKTGVDVSDNLDALVTQLQTPFLVEFLGADLYADMVSDCSTSIPEKWELLFDGETVEISEHKYVFRGLKESFRAYVYYHWLVLAVRPVAGIGMIKPMAENGTPISVEWSLANTWNYYLECRQCDMFSSNYISAEAYVNAKNDEDPTTFPKFLMTWDSPLNPLVTW